MGSSSNGNSGSGGAGSVFSLTELIAEAREAQRAEYAEYENERIGTLRGGNSSVLHPDGYVIGKCQRLTHLRSLGIQSTPSEEKSTMFDGGFANELRWMERLESVWPGKILCEEEYPIEWYASNGTRVTLRPDMVLVGEGKGAAPVALLEHKKVSSLWTARDVAILGRPKSNHLIQAAHLLDRSGIPTKLVYSSYENYAVAGWAVKHFPEHGEPGSEYCDYREDKKSGTLWIDKMIPFRMIYDVAIDPNTGTILYRQEGGADSDWTHSIFRAQWIADYYEYVSRIGETHDLGLKPKSFRPDGSKESWTECGSCPLATLCGKGRGEASRIPKEKYGEWLGEASDILHGRSGRSGGEVAEVIPIKSTKRGS